MLQFHHVKQLVYRLNIYMYNKDRHIVLALFNKVDSSTYKFYLESFEFMFYSYFSKRGKIKN